MSKPKTPTLDFAARMFSFLMGDEKKKRDPFEDQRCRVGKTRRERSNGVLDRHAQNKLNEADFNRSGDPKDRPTHFNGKKQFSRRVTVSGNKSKIMDRVGKHELDDKLKEGLSK